MQRAKEKMFFDLNLENIWLGFYFPLWRTTILLGENCCFLMARGLELWQVIQVSLKQRFYNCWESFFSNKPCRNWRFWSSLQKTPFPSRISLSLSNVVASLRRFSEKQTWKKKYSRMGSLIFVCEIWTKACFSKRATMECSF